MRRLTIRLEQDKDKELFHYEKCKNRGIDNLLKKYEHFFEKFFIVLSFVNF